MWGYYYTMKSNISFTFNYSNFIADMDNRDNSKLVAKVIVPVFDHVSMVVGYKDESMEAQETVNRFTHDKTVFTAIKFEL